MNLIKSKKRVLDHGEVFTSPWLVDNILNLVSDETQRIDSRFLEPACGSGNFLTEVLQRKLATADEKFKKCEYERLNYSLLGLMCLYGIELLYDNVMECHSNLIDTFSKHLKLERTDELYLAASFVLSCNLIHGDALKMQTYKGEPITFAEWGYIGRGKFQRRDFRFDVLTRSLDFNTENCFSSHLGRHELFTPVGTFPPMTVHEIATICFKESLDFA